jgi:glycosyltransferase involved in cell wall biosynthesis
MSEERKGLVLLFTYATSLSDWVDVGFLDREAAYYRRLGEAMGGTTFLTYGGDEDAGIAADLDCIRVLHNRRGVPPRRFSLEAAWRYRRDLRQARLVKTNQIRGAWAGVIAKWLAGTRLVVRGGYIPSLHRARDGAGRYERARLWLEEAIALWAADRIFLTTEDMLDHVVRAYGVRRSKIHVIPNFIQVDLFAPDPKSRRVPGLIGYVGRLTARKNVQALVEAVAGLDDARLLLIGSGPLRPVLEEQARRLGVDVEFVGNVPNRDVPCHLNRCQVFAFPTLYEGHPKALLEAMACGLPVVATPVSGIRNLIRHGEEGYLCADTSAEAIAEGLRHVLSNRRLGERMGREARRFVRKNYALESVVSKELAVYREMGLL